MRFNIERFQQSTLLELGLDLKDMTILMYIIDFYNSSRMFKKIINYKDFFWIDYQTVLDELPILDIKSRRPLARRFDKYVECGLMEKHIVKGEDFYIHNGQEKKRNKHGTYIYFHFIPEILEKLFNGSGPINTKNGKNQERGMDSKVQREAEKKQVKSRPCVPESTEGSGPESTPKDSFTIFDSFAKDTNLIVQEAQNNQKFTKAFSEFLSKDDNEHRKKILYWIFHNAQKYESTLEDIINALEICYDKDKVEDMAYFTGILRTKAKNRYDGIKPLGKPVYWIIDEYLRKRLKQQMEYIKNYDIDLNNFKLFYTVFCPEDREAVHDVMKIAAADLEKETGVKLEPAFRINYKKKFIEINPEKFDNPEEGRGEIENFDFDKITESEKKEYQILDKLEYGGYTYLFRDDKIIWDGYQERSFQLFLDELPDHPVTWKGRALY